MPVQYYNDYSPVGLGYMTSQSKRDRTWTNTLGFPLSDPSNLPENSYSDYKVFDAFAERTAITQSYLHPPYGSTTSYLQWPQSPDTLEGFYGSQQQLSRTDESLFNEAFVKAAVKVADAKTNLAVMFAEKRKTSDLILGTATKFYTAYRQFRRGNVAGAARVLNANPNRVHKTWLEMSYGWMPLLMDVKNSAEITAQRYGYERPPRFTVNVKIEDDAKYVVTQPGNNRMGFDTNLEKQSYNITRHKECRVKLELEISNPYASVLQQLGLTNPALVAWELVPFSFVFDWFIHVGDWLQARTAFHGITVRKAMVSHLLAVNGSATETFPGYTGYYYRYNGWSNTRRVKIRYYRRYPFTVDPSTLSVPYDFSVPNWRRVVSGLALLRAQASRLG